MPAAAIVQEAERETGTQDVWRTGAAVFYQGGLGSDTWLVDGRAVPVSRHRSQVAIICGGALATFEQLEARVAQALPTLERDEIRASLRWLAECGILRSGQQLTEDLRCAGRETSSVRPEPDIATLGIITANRPQALRDCAESFLAHFHQCGHNDIQYVIADDSRSSEDLSANSRLCDQLRGSIGRPFVIHLTGRDKANLRRELIRQGIPRETAEFALPVPGEQFCGPGANRNWMLALFAEKFLSVDDDTVCRLWRHPETRDALRLNGHEDPCEYWFPLSRSETSQTPVAPGADLLRSHGQLLGRHVAEMASAALETRDACAHLLPASGKLNAKVALTYTGLAGDSGMFSGMRFLTCQGETRARLAADRALYNRAIGRREIARIALCATVTHDQICMATTMGIDNREPVPPFPPGWRGEDKVFGSALAQLFPHSVTGDVPLGIIHNADRPGAYAVSIFEAAAVSRVCDLLGALIVSMAVPKNLYSTASRWRMLSEYFLEAANSSPDAFRDLMLRGWVESRMRTVRMLERCKAEFAYPKYWADDIDRYCRSLLDSLPEFFHRGPAEFRDRGCSADEAFSQFRHVCRGMAGMFSCWGSICEAARQLRSAMIGGTLAA